MQEQSVMEVVKWFMAFFFIMFMLAVASFLMQAQDSNSIKQTVNYTIERNGGLTAGADGSAAYLKEVSKTTYGDRFTVVGLVESPTGKITIGGKKYKESATTGDVGFGNKVHYIIKLKYNIPFFNIETASTSFMGTSVSQVRTGEAVAN